MSGTTSLKQTHTYIHISTQTNVADYGDLKLDKSLDMADSRVIILWKVVLV